MEDAPLNPTMTDPQIMHIVLFKWKADTPPERVEQVRQALLGLRDAIPGILEITCGQNFSDRAQGYETALVVRFESRAALDAYLPHPAHRALVDTLINPLREASLAVDYRVG